MSKIVNIKEKPAFEEGVRVITNPKAELELGGKEPPKDWLTPMSKGTKFLVRPKKSTSWILYEFEVWEHSKYNVMLLDLMYDKFDWVHPTDFCDNFKLEEIIEFGEEEEDTVEY